MHILFLIIIVPLATVCILNCWMPLLDDLTEIFGAIFGFLLKAAAIISYFVAPLLLVDWAYGGEAPFAIYRVVGLLPWAGIIVFLICSERRKQTTRGG